jgi:hypothetical protein
VPVLDYGAGAPAYLGQVQSATDDMPRKISDLASAWHAQRFLRGEALSAQERTYLGNYWRDYALVRSWLWECHANRETDLQWDSAIVVAGEINNGLPPAQASALWRGVLAGRCRASLSAVQLQWIELFAAVGARDATATRVASDRLRERKAASTAIQHEYLLLAAVVARTTLGQPMQAREVFRDELPHIPAARLELPWIRYLSLLLSAMPETQAGKAPAAVASAPASASTNGR